MLRRGVALAIAAAAAACYPYGLPPMPPATLYKAMLVAGELEPADADIEVGGFAPIVFQAFTTDPLRFYVLNKSQAHVVVDWDRSALVMPNGESKRIIHKETPFAQRGAPQTPTAIAPGSRIEQAVLPADSLILLDYAGWRQYPFATSAGQRMRLLLSYTADGKPATATMPVLVESVQTHRFPAGR